MTPLDRSLPVKLKLLAQASNVVFPGRTVDLPTVVLYSNAHLCGQPLATQALVCGPYHARRMLMEAVELHRLPDGATILGNDTFWVRTEAGLVAEQISPLTSDLPALLAVEESHARELVELHGPCVLVARYGASTWGHWLAEILPAAVVAERTHPGKFRFIVAESTTVPGPDRDFATAVLESLRAYGIEEDRLVRIRGDTRYRCAELHLVSGLWSVAALNPDVMALMRTGLVQPTPSATTPSRRVALLRPEGTTRALFNNAAVTTMLRQRGFDCVDIAELTFLEQVAMFAGAEQVVGSLGSGLTGLIYARDGVQVISLGPADWYDFYFYMLVQHRNGVFIDLRGPVVWNGNGPPRDGRIALDPDQLDIAFAMLEQAHGTPPETRDICGHTLLSRTSPGFFAIDFAATGNAGGFLDHGFSFQEPLHVWSVGPCSRITVPREALQSASAEADWLVELHVSSFAAPPSLVARTMTVSANGREIGRFAVSDPVTINCRIPKHIVQDCEALRLTFDHPVCPPATVLGMGGDARELGIAFSLLRLHALGDA